MTNTATFTLWLDGDQGYMRLGQYATMNAAERDGEKYVASTTHYGTRYSVDTN